MKTYYEYTEKERAAFTEEQIKSFIAVQLMSEGVESPEPPTLEPLEDVNVGKKVLVFAINAKGKYGSVEHLGLCFDTLQQAQDFIALRPCKRDYDYETGSNYNYSMPLVEMCVSTEELYQQSDVARVASILKQNKSKAERNERLNIAHNKACEASRKVSAALWDDWYECRRVEDAHKRVLSTLKEYIGLSNGEVDTAYRFLSKRFNAEEIASAKQWLEGQFPDDPSTLPQAA